jgi:hypothetical protein
MSRSSYFCPVDIAVANRKSRKIHVLPYILYPTFWYYGRDVLALRGNNMRRNCGGPMRYFVIGAIALVVVVAGASILPDLARYIKISSM